MPLLRAIWDRYLYLPSFEDKSREAIALSILRIYAAIFVMAVITVTYYLINEIWLHGLLLSGVVLVGMYSLKYIRQGQFESAFVLSASVAIAGLIIAISFASGLYAPEILILFPTLVVFSYFAPPKVMYVWLVVLVGWIWGLYFIQSFGVFEINPTRVGPFGQALFLSLIIIFSVMVLQFTTQRMKAANESLSLAKLAAEETSQAKSTFLAMMSHELRTPLNAIIGYSEIMIEELKDQEDTSEDHLIDLDRIKKSGHQLLAIINDILDLSKIDADKIDLRFSIFSLEGLIQDMVETIRPMLSENENRIDMTFERVEMPVFIRSDRERLGQIILNLLSNAAKFTYQGDICIGVFGLDDELLIKVVDSGIGIAEQDISKIFDSFQQIDNSMSRKTDGTGLGLAISKRLASLIGGDLFVESQLGVGSVFTLSISKHHGAYLNYDELS